jgi:hypothetical protein
MAKEGKPENFDMGEFDLIFGDKNLTVKYPNRTQEIYDVATTGGSTLILQKGNHTINIVHNVLAYLKHTQAMGLSTFGEDKPAPDSFRRVWKPIKPLTSSCGNATHGEEMEPAISETRLPKSRLFQNQLKKSLLLPTVMQLTSATVSVTATPVSANTRVSDADGAWVVPSATEVSVRPSSSAVVSRPESHTTSPAQLISEPLIARDTLATGEPRSAQPVTMVNSQML